MPKPPPYADWNHFKVCEESSEEEEEEEEEEEVGQQEDKDEKGQDDNDVQEEQRSRSPEKRRGSSLMLGRYFVLPAGIYLSAGGASHAGPLTELLAVAPSSSGAHLSEEEVNEEVNEEKAVKTPFHEGLPCGRIGIALYRRSRRKARGPLTL